MIQIPECFPLDSFQYETIGASKQPLKEVTKQHDRSCNIRGGQCALNCEYLCLERRALGAGDAWARWRGRSAAPQIMPSPIFRRLLVGAPLDQNRQPNTTRSGALWKCPLTTSISDCTQVVTDGKRSELNLWILPLVHVSTALSLTGELSVVGGARYSDVRQDRQVIVKGCSCHAMFCLFLFLRMNSFYQLVRYPSNEGLTVPLAVDNDNLLAPHPDEIKDGQWLGVSVRSQGPGRKVVVCAHRYIRKSGESQYGQGLCYTLANDLQILEVSEPCSGLSVQREHEEYGFCQVGTSSSLLSDETLLLGSPGPYTWRGTIFTMDVTDDILERDHSTFMAPVADGASPVEKYSYLGMAVAGAPFFSTKMSFAAGAPRARGSGQVVIFSKRQVTDWSSPDVTILIVNLVLTGEQFGSNYGYEVSSADVNGDGLPDLLVGAPFYFSRDAGGAVYLHLNKDHTISQKHNVKLTGKPESQYGIAIANAGDLNKDGCEDVIIGSPYEGNGVIYVHLGNRKTGLEEKPDQVIASESLPYVMRTFGYSLSGGMDLDANGYPDLLVGAYENSSVALILTRPIIDIKTSIQPTSMILNIDPSKIGCEKDPGSNHTCFHFETCCTIESLVTSMHSNVYTLNYVIEAETFPGGKKFSRVFFGNDPTARRSNVVDRNIELRKDVRDCRQHVVYLKNNTRDIQTPMKFQVTYSLVQSQPSYRTSGPLANIDDYPVLNATATNFFSANFLNDCGLDGVCISDLTVKAELSLPRASTEDTYTLTLGQDEEIKLVVYVDNLGESAYEAQLFIQHDANLHYIAANASDKHVICSSLNKTIVSCMLENPFKKQPNDSKPITFRFDSRVLEDNELSIDFNLWANSTSKEKNPNKPPKQVTALVVKNAELSIKGVARPEQVFYGGEVKGESAMKYFDEIGTRVIHTYYIYNEGPWRVSSVQVSISWPHQVAASTAQGKWLLYLEDPPTVEGEQADQSNGQCFKSDTEINPLKLSTRPGVSEPALENLEMGPLFSSGKVNRDEESHNRTVEKYESASANKVRRKRENEVVKAEAYTDKDGQRKQVVNMNCSKKTAKCIHFECVIYKLGRMQTATITVRARLWNATLVEDYPRVSHVNIASSATIHVSNSVNLHQNRRQDDFTTVETIAYPDLRISESTEVPLWVIILSVILGLLVLILLIIALWKLGFFKRSRPDPTLSGNLEKNNHEGSPFIVHDRNSFR
ncbi:Integrin alpha-PS1 [Eumeta japonica]|uniref:Integrin alpha-PS1 n=1 Tax=Eumeta variegata TaxID=151549 RepID=A0A4C1UXJ0_EUMVA|nr:Integrin alpha-PS1 [Eumeta japonica]